MLRLSLPKCMAWVGSQQENATTNHKLDLNEEKELQCRRRPFRPINACAKVANLCLFVHVLCFLNAECQTSKQHSPHFKQVFGTTQSEFETSDLPDSETLCSNITPPRLSCPLVPLENETMSELVCLQIQEKRQLTNGKCTNLQKTTIQLFEAIQSIIGAHHFVGRPRADGFLQSVNTCQGS